MSQIQSHQGDSRSPPAHSAGRSRARALWIGGLVLILLALVAGKSIEDQLKLTGMPDIGSGELPTLAQLAAMLFAFAFSLGLALCALAALGAGPRSGRSWLVLGTAGALVVVAPVLVPTVLGRGLVSYQFGVGGIVIAIGAVTTFWSILRLREALPEQLTLPGDLATLGLLCLAAAAWNLCGSAAMPSFLLMPERMAALHTLPFAIGQTKSVQVLLAGGWALLAAAALLAASRIARAGTDD